MKSVILCTISLALANFGVEWFRDVPNYIHAGEVTWHQFLGIVIYYILWTKNEVL